MKSMIMGGGLAFALMAGCSSIQDAIDSAEDDVDQVAATEAYAGLQEDLATSLVDLGELDPTLDADLPLNGTATYAGQAEILMDTPNRESNLVGDASLTADFAAGDVTGTMGGFYGSVDGGEIGKVDGELVVSYGEIDASIVEEVYIELDGVLTTAADGIVVVDASLAGGFLGDPDVLDEPPAGLLLNSTGDSEFELSGSDVTGSMTIVGMTGN
ncbi:MAG: hypothetical protein NTX73_04995 [Rhodobacterales bacterium]|nr:hypothetical protein [Rhodobacterales bacterium]